MSRPNDSHAHPGRGLLFAAMSAAALALASGGGACSTSTLQPFSTGTAGTGGSGDTGATTGGAGGTGVGGSSGAAGSSCAAVHRAPGACPQSVASPNQQACTSDAECVGSAMYQATGRCIPFNGQMLCSYDTCLSDDDCGGSPAVCLCGGQWRVYSAVSPGNACRTGNCRTDNDCSGTVCSPSVGSGAAFYGYIGYYCHTPQDQCRCDSDCATGSCAYNPEIGAWACASFGGAG
jgi:hypothetical protein